MPPKDPCAATLESALDTLAGAGVEVEMWRTLRGMVTLAVRVGDERHKRTFTDREAMESREYEMAGVLWRMGDAMQAEGEPLVALRSYCRALGLLFPHLRERLPA